MKNKKNGFTLIELLVVIAIVGLLSSVVLATLSGARAKSRDSKRASDMHQIVLALNLFYSQNGCLPITNGSTCLGAGGYSQIDAASWDYSSQGGGFMTFLQTSGFMSKVPVDPTNNMTGDSVPVGTFSYKYYCWTGQGGRSGAHLGYWRESDGQYIAVLGSTSPDGDRSYTCE